MQIQKECGYSIKDQILTYKHLSLVNNVELWQYGIFDDKFGTLPFITILGNSTIYIRSRKDYMKGKSHIEVLGENIPIGMKQVVDGVKRGLNAGLAPELTFEGTSGAYFMRNDKQVPVAVFKPIDEEANAPNNPRGLTNKFGSPSLRSGVLSGEACEREIAAYLVDKDGFSEVPETVLVSISHPSFNFGLIVS